MNLHEYQSKQLFIKYGLPVSKGTVASTAEEALIATRELGGNQWAVKAQVHAGGRGKAGGIKLVSTAEEAAEFAGKMLGKNLVTPQTKATGQPIYKIFIEQAMAIESELYLAIVIDRAEQKIAFMASTEGGTDIEEVAATTPEKIFRVHLNPVVGAQPWQGRWLAFKLGLTQIKEFTDLFLKVAKMFTELDCSLLEINPLVVTKSGKLCCLDAKINIDDNALFRNPEITAMRDPTQEDEQEREAEKFNLNYIALDGSIGCMVNGAGLAMATMDLVQTEGGHPANFLDVGGGATKEAVAQAFKIILSDPQVKTVLINIFGGIVSCSTIAEGIVAAMEKVHVSVPVVVRFEGSNAEAGRSYLQENANKGLNIIATTGLLDAAKKAVGIAAGKI